MREVIALEQKILSDAAVYVIESYFSKIIKLPGVIKSVRMGFGGGVELLIAIGGRSNLISRSLITGSMILCACLLIGECVPNDHGGTLRWSDAV